MLLDFPLFREDFLQKIWHKRHLRQRINERNVHMQCLNHIMKISELGNKFGLGKSLRERHGWYVTFRERGLRLLGPLTLILLLGSILTRQSFTTLIMVLVNILLNSCTLNTFYFLKCSHASYSDLSSH